MSTTNQTENLSITDAAAMKLHELLKAENNPSLKLRIFIAGGGCSGMQFGFSFEDEAMENDIVLEKKIITDSVPESVSILIDPASLPYLKGAEIDFVNDNCGEQFIIRNANMPHSCSGCSGSCGSCDDSST